MNEYIVTLNSFTTGARKFLKLATTVLTRTSSKSPTTVHNLRLTNQYREEGGQWTLDPALPIPGHILALLRDSQRLEPVNDWRLETRGVERDWHRVDMLANWLDTALRF